LIFNERSRIADLALKTRLPAISLFNSFPNVGGLMAYGPNLASMFKRVANYVVRIFSGANPGELPIERPSKFELVINLKTAKALGLTIPEPFLVRADGLIEMIACGTPRRFAAVRRFGRDRSEADMPRASGAGRSDENDPTET
jgi:putative ABC transport system substrate-binding protein